MRKIKITIKQLIKVLETENPKFPMTIFMSGIEKEEIQQLIKLLNSKK